MITAEDLAPEGGAPLLDVAPDRPGAPAHRWPLERTADGFRARFEVTSTERAVTLRLCGGGPILLRALRLEAQLSGRGPV